MNLCSLFITSIISEWTIIFSFPDISTPLVLPSHTPVPIKIESSEEHNSSLFHNLSMSPSIIFSALSLCPSFLKINCKLEKLEQRLSDFEKENGLKKDVFKNNKSINNLMKLKKEIKFNTNFGREIEYYTGIVFEVYAGNKEVARGGRYDDLLKSLGAKKNIQAVGAAINLNNLN